MPGFVQVAWSRRRGYAARVSRLHFHRWAVIFLLVSKLILGELTHAMPQMDHSAAAMNEEIVTLAHASHDSPPCGEHAQDTNSDDHATKNCCKGGECACPCLHTPAAVTAVPSIMQLTHDDQAAVLVQGATLRRSSGLFRPPA